MELLSDIPPLLSACGLPAYTNYVRGFQGCLDYIFIQPDCIQVLMAEDIGETHFCFNKLSYENLSELVLIYFKTIFYFIVLFCLFVGCYGI